MSHLTITFEVCFAESESQFLQQAVETALKAYRARKINRLSHEGSESCSGHSPYSSTTPAAPERCASDDISVSHQPCTTAGLEAR